MRHDGRLAHLLYDRLLPLVLIVVLPLLAAGWAWQEKNARERHKAAIAGCERANVIRENQRVIMSTLIRMAEQVSEEAGSEELRAYFTDLIPDLQMRLDSPRMAEVDCEAVV